MYYIYILKSLKTGEFYKVITIDLKRRLLEHNSGKNFSTKGKCPWKMVYYEECSDRNEARKKEKYFKSGFGRELLKNF